MTQVIAPRQVKVAARKSQNDSVKSLMGLVNNLKSGAIVFAPHQREFIWDRVKISGWCQTLISATSSDTSARPTGFFVTYQLTEGDTVYLNDGLQRLMSTVLFLNDPRSYGISKEKAAEIVEAFEMPVQHRIYRSHEEAMIAFQLINYATPLTNYEFCAGFLGDLENSTTNWRPTLKEFNDFLNTHFQTHGYARTLSRDQQHLKIRHNYLLLYLYLAGVKTLRVPVENIGVKQVSLASAARGRNVEQVLRKELENRGIAYVTDTATSFKNLIIERTSFIERAMAEVYPAGDKRISDVLLRYLAAIYIISLNAGVDVNLYNTFVYKLLPLTGGSATAVVVDKATGDLVARQTLSLGRFNNFNGLCKVVGVDLADAIYKANGETVGSTFKPRKR
jgi:hypothetical protein